MDDANWESIPEDHRAQAESRLLQHLGSTRAFLFVIGRHVDNPHGAALLREWESHGHLLGNHTYSHKPLLSKHDPEQFEQDVLRNDHVLSQYKNFRKWFRFPQLKEGSTAEVRDRLRAFLAQNGYRNGCVTIDASDWYYDQRLKARLRASPDFDVTHFRQPYLEHIWDRAAYYDGLSREVLGRSIAHTLLIHYNLLNSLFLGDLMEMFRKKGWEIIPAEEAFSDPVFTRKPNTVPAGESLIWALAKEAGRSGLRYPAEDDVYEKPILDRLTL